MPVLQSWASASVNAWRSWAQPSSAAYELISTTVLGSAAASVTFSSTAAWANYKHLQIRASHVSNTGANGTYIRMTFNADSGSNYSFHYLYGQGSSALSSPNATQTAIAISPISGTGSSGQADAVITDLLDFSSTSKNKTVRSLAGFAPGSINLLSGAWYSSNAVTSITLSAYSQGSASTFGTGARFSVYGLRG